MLSCSPSYKDIKLEQALQLAGRNRKTLENVLNHYKHDSLKYQAASFLIKNMPYHYSLEEYYLSSKGEKYRPDIRKFKHGNDLKKHCDSLIRCGYIEKRNIVYDIISIDSTFLICNIDLAFKVWDKPWSQDVSFRDFCKYILPYRSRNDKILRYITAPFYVNKTGNVHLFIPQLGNKRSFTLKKRKTGRIYTLHYWDINRRSFIPIPYKELTDTTQIYEQIPNNALLWFTLPERIVNQRIFFIKQDTIKSY